MKKLFFIVSLIVLSISAFTQKRLSHPKTREELLNEKYCSGLFNTQQADYFDFLNDKNTTSATGYLNVLDWLQGRVAGLRIYTAGTNVRIPYIRNQRAGVYVDEIWVSYDYINSLPVSDIAMIKIIKGPFIGGWGGAGAIAIYTIRGDDEEEEDMQH